MSQKDKILVHLKTGGGLTPYQALKNFGCLRLAARIQELRDSGYPIETLTVKRDGKRYARYWLRKAK